jgi:glycosyltransferase involved in cell wall biosynthesis
VRLLFVVQRYGHEVAGGAEVACREFATRLSARGHRVEVLTSCAISYVDWANAYDPGTQYVDGIPVHRLPVARAREERLFTPLDLRRASGSKPVPLQLQREWMRMQGPELPELPGWLAEKAGSCDAVIFFTYLYYTTWKGLPVASAFAPTVLHPTAHDEPPLYLPLFDSTFWIPSAFAFLTVEEANLVRRRFRVKSLSSVIGMGVDLEAIGDAESFRAAYGLGDRPYLTFIGRVDPAKGSDELVDFFVSYKQRNPGPLALVIVGERVRLPKSHPDVILTGFVDESVKRSAIAGTLALVLPSYFESFSIVLTEGWAQGKPALVNGHCAVLDGQARRARGGIPYRSFAEFEAGLDFLVEDPKLAAALGAAGRRYVERNYRWDTVLDRYERLLSLL